MEPAGQVAPPVVAVMVVHEPDAFSVRGEPGAWFGEVLDGLRRQDYANMRTLVLLTGATGDLAERIATAVPRSFVRAVETADGFGRAANEVLRLVDGDNGFFCFLHDDVALEPDAIRLLVEEMYRSNAGIVGPKLVGWDDPTVLQHVGYGVDRFGEIDPLVEPDETDQEQHDAVRDVFAIPSACLMVRADLFRSLGGFDPDISYHGEDVDLCWRAHHQGARVLVVPSSKARHLEALDERRPDLDHELLRARHRMRTVASLTGIRRLPLLAVQLTLITLAQFVVGILTGRVARAVAGVRSLVGLAPRLPWIIARRRTVAAGRLVPDREVTGLQLRGSARLASYLRSRDARPDAHRGQGRAWRERAGVSAVVGWIGIITLIVAVSRELLTGGVPAFGEFLPFGASPRELLRGYLSGWNPQGIGQSGASPTGVALLAAGSAATLFRMGLFHTLCVVGLVVAGAVGMWRLTAAFSITRARLGSTLVYVALPLPGQLISVGRWGALLCFAAVPWSIDLMRNSAGLVPGPRDEDGERTASFSVRRQVRALAAGALVAAIATGFEPSYPLILVFIAVLVALATLLTGAPGSVPIRLLVAGVAAAGGAVLLNLPWLLELAGDGGWTAIVGPAPVGDRGYSVLELATFDVGNARAVLLAVALYLPVLTGALIGRGWRFGWAARGAFLVIGFGWLAVLDDGGALPVRLPEPGILLVPVAVGVALSAGCVIASFELDVRGGTFGWRQPLSVLSIAAVAVGLVPALFAVGTGRYDAPETTLVDLLEQLPDGEDAGDYRVLWVGTNDVLPVVPWVDRPGVGYAVTNGPSLDVRDAFPARPGPGSEDVLAALDAIATGTTTRGGRLLAPLAIRYVIVPLVDGAVSTDENPLPPPEGLTDALGDQLDLAEVFSPPNFILYENRAWVPVRSVLTVAGAEASREAGAAALAQRDLAGATPIMTGADQLDPADAAVSAGTVHFAIAPDRRWQLDVDGLEVAARPAFGVTMAFDVASAGTATLAYRPSRSFQLSMLVLGLAWGAVAFAASSMRWRRPAMQAQSTGSAPSSTILTLDPILATSTSDRGLDPADGTSPWLDDDDVGHAAAVDLSETDLDGADLDGADLDGADLDGADNVLDGSRAHDAPIDEQGVIPSNEDDDGSSDGARS